MSINISTIPQTLEIPVAAPRAANRLFVFSETRSQFLGNWRRMAAGDVENSNQLSEIPVPASPFCQITLIQPNQIPLNDPKPLPFPK